MRRVGFLLILVGLWAAPVFSGKNPHDIEFKIRFVGDKSFFNIGEPIEIEICTLRRVEKNISEVGLHPARGSRA